MKITTKLLLKTLKHDKHMDVREYLREKLDNKKLTEKQIRYLIKNMNTNFYMLQNIYPVAEAMENGISVEVIEECASLLDDALNSSSFSLENGKGKLYNKIPYNLEHFLQFDWVKYYSECRAWHFDSSYAYNKIQQVSTCLHQCHKLRSISQELFWELIEDDNVLNIFYINKYNEIISTLDQDNQKCIFRIDELLSIGMNLFEISLFDYEKSNNLVEILENTKEDISNNIMESVDFKLKDEDYILQVTLLEPVGLMIFADGKIQEINFLEQPPIACLFYNPMHEEDYILESDRRFDLLMAKFSQYVYQLEKEIHYTKEYEDQKQKERAEKIHYTKECEKKKRKEREKLSINGEYIPDIIEELESHAWNNDGDTTRIIQVDKNTIIMRGYIYEPSWESFGTASSISLNGQCLYGIDSHNVGSYHNEVYNKGKLETLEEAIQYIKNEVKK